jgi:hypothetical protein
MENSGVIFFEATRLLCGYSAAIANSGFIKTYKICMIYAKNMWKSRYLTKTNVFLRLYETRDSTQYMIHGVQVLDTSIT